MKYTFVSSLSAVIQQAHERGCKGVEVDSSPELATAKFNVNDSGQDVAIVLEQQLPVLS